MREAMHRPLVIGLGFLVGVGLALQAPAAAASSSRGWQYLIDKLAADGVPRASSAEVFRDSRMGPFTGLYFSIEPREPSSMYRAFRRPASLAKARECRARYDRYFRRAESRLGVPASVLSAILHVETHCGQNTGRSVVLQRLARLAMANEPQNLRNNIARQTKGLSPASARRIEARVRERARYLEDMFYPEVLSTFRIAARLDIDPLGIRGSGSGAFGMPQFLPSSYMRFGIDGDGDGRISLYDPADAIASAANYLAHHGWRREVTYDEQRRAIWWYNRSDAYIDTILFLAHRIDQSHPSRLRVEMAER